MRKVVDGPVTTEFFSIYYWPGTDHLTFFDSGERRPPQTLGWGTVSCQGGRMTDRKLWFVADVDPALASRAHDMVRDLCMHCVPIAA